MTESDAGLSRRQVLSGMAGVAAAGAIFGGFGATDNTIVTGNATVAEPDIVPGPTVRPICAADWAAACWWKPRSISV